MKTSKDKSTAKASLAKMPSMKTSRPIYWKQVLVTTFTVYPLLIGIQWFLNLIFPMQELKKEIAILIVVSMVASLMVFPVMPFIMKRLGPWLHKK